MSALRKRQNTSRLPTPAPLLALLPELHPWIRYILLLNRVRTRTSSDRCRHQQSASSDRRWDFQPFTERISSSQHSMRIHVSKHLTALAHLGWGQPAIRVCQPSRSAKLRPFLRSPSMQRYRANATLSTARTGGQTCDKGRRRTAMLPHGMTTAANWGFKIRNSVPDLGPPCDSSHPHSVPAFVDRALAAMSPRSPSTFDVSKTQTETKTPYRPMEAQPNLM